VAVRVFISYAPQDDGFLTELEKHLVLLKQQRVIDVWTRRRISAGDELPPPTPRLDPATPSPGGHPAEVPGDP